MANTFLNPAQVVNTYLGILMRDIVLPRVVTRRPLDDFRGTANDTVSLRVPAVLTGRDYEWRTRTNPIVVDDLTETKVDVTLNKHPYHAGSITDEQLTLDIRDFGVQVAQPQARAVGEKLEGYIAAALTAGTYQTTVTFDNTASESGTNTHDPYIAAVRARAALNRNNVPLDNRYIVMGTDVETAFLSSDRITRAQNAGDQIASNALQDATLGRVAGFTLLTSNAIPAGEAYALHATAIVLATGAPAVPDGATFGQVQTYQGLSMRWLRDYDPNYLRDRSIFSAFAGVTLVADGPDGPDAGTAPDVVRAVKIAFTAAA